MAVSLTVVGSANVDLVARCERLPRMGETVTDASFEIHPGGKGANQAVAAARLGAEVSFVGCVGDDANGRLALTALADSGVATEGVRVAGGPTGVALILVDARGENQIVVAPGANAKLQPDDVRVGGAAGVLVQLEIPAATVEAAADRAKGLFALNAAPARRVSRAVLQRADVVVVNRHELEALGAPDDLRLVALTLGAEGAVLLEHGREIARAAPPRVRAVDGTAAGDAFTACLVVSLLEEMPPSEALRRACAAGALAASRAGAQPSLPTAADVAGILA